jgi:uncharacterized protein
MVRGIYGTIKPNAGITPIFATEFRVAVSAPAQDGKANQALVELLASYFTVPKSTVTILRCHAARKKLVELKG